MSTFVPRFTMAAVVLCAALAGCTGDPQPAPSSSTAGVPPPSAAASATSSATPSATPVPAPTRPPELDQPGTDGAVAAARYFVSLYPYVYSTGDLAEWTAMSDPECIFCTSVIDNVTAMVSEGHHVEGAEIQIESVSQASPAGPEGPWPVDVTISQAPSVEVGIDGSTVRSTSGGRAVLMIDLVRDQHWSVRAVDLEVLG